LILNGCDIISRMCCAELALNPKDYRALALETAVASVDVEIPVI